MYVCVGVARHGEARERHLERRGAGKRISMVTPNEGRAFLRT